MAKKKKIRSSNKTSMPVGKIVAVAAIIVLGFGILIVRRDRNEAAESITVNSVVLSSDDLSLGKIVYAENCASCHGENLEGQYNWKEQNPDGTFKAPPHDEDGHTWHHNDQYLLDRIRYGTQDLEPSMQAQSNMPAYVETLSDEEIDAVLGYIKSTWSPRIQELQAQR